MAGLGELEESLACARKEYRQQCDQERYRKRRKLEDDSPGHATPHVRRCCVYVFVLGGHCASTAADFLNTCRARRGAPQFPSAQLEEIIEKWFLEWHTSSPESLIEPVTLEDKRAHDTARRYCDDRQLHAWVAEQNSARGLAPRTSAVGDMYDDITMVRRREGDAGFVMRANIGLSKNRTFFSRWRKRVGVKIRTLPPSGHMEEAEKQEKVPSFHSSNVSVGP
jgi:hypothetical protein